MKNSLFSDAVVYLFLFGLFGGLATMLTNPQEPDLVTMGFQISWILVYCLFSILIVFNKQLHFFRVELPVLFFAAYVVISTSWSKDFSATILYSISLTVNLLFSIYVSRKYSTREFLRKLAMFLTVYNGFGLLMYAVGVEQAFYIDPLDRSSIIGLELFKGFFSHKIYAGYYCAFTFFVSYLYFDGLKKIILCSINLFLVLLSGSSLSVVFFLVMVIVLASVAFIIKSEQKVSISVAALYLVCFVSVGVYFNYENILLGLGRDVTLTGRTELWEWALYFIEQRPLFGWGYSGIFFEGNLSPSNIINDFSYYQAPHFHNSYLQIAAELGVFGLIIFLYFYFKSISNCFVLLTRAGEIDRGDNLLLLSFFISSMVIFTSMNIGLRYNEFMTFFIFYIYLATGRRLKD